MIKSIKKTVLFAITLMILCLLLCSCISLPIKRGTFSKNGQYTVNENQPILAFTDRYDGGFFSVDIPAGWVVETVGEYINFGFRAYDPDRPERQFFYYGKQDVFLKSAQAKAKYRALADLAGANEQMGYHMMADAPVLTSPTTEFFFSIYNTYADYINKYGISHKLTPMNNLQIIEAFPGAAAASPKCLDNTVLRAAFSSDGGVACQALLSGQVIDYFTEVSTFPGLDMGFYAIYGTCGVVAPTGEFAELEETLTACLASFVFTDEYVKEALADIASETEAILANARATQAVYQSYNDAWSARQTSYDIISQKNSDAALGCDRLYDPETGEVYRAEVGFYDTYDANREQFSNGRLQRVDDASDEYYLRPVDYYINSK